MKFLDPLPLTNADNAALVRLFPLLRTAVPNTRLGQFFGDSWGALNVSQFVPKMRGQPAFYIAGHDQSKICLIDGVSDREQCRQTMDGYAGIIQSGFNDPSNEFLTIWSQGVLDVLERNNAFNGDTLLLCGWSLGGAIAQRIPTLRLAAKQAGAAKVNVISFGSPRVGSEALARRIGVEGNQARYMAYDDPIPNYPPRSGTFTWIPFAVGIRASLRFSQFCHGPGGKVLAADGGILNLEVPTAGQITPRTALDVFWNGLAADSLGPHSLDHYARLFEINPVATKPNIPANVTPREHRQDALPAEFHAQERNTVNLVRDLQARQDQNVFIPRERLAHAVRQGRVWYVILNDVPLMMTPTKKRARGLARDLNQFLRRMQTTAYVDPVALQSQLEAFLQFASESSGGFKPTLSTSLPL